MTLLIESVINDSGQVQAVNTGTADSFSGAHGYLANEALCTLDAVASTDSAVAGIKVSPAGFIRCFDATSALPSDVHYIGGLAVTSTGQLCITTDTASPTYTVGKIGITQGGAVYMTSLV